MFIRYALQEVIKTKNLLLRYPISFAATVLVMCLVFIGIYETSLGLLTRDNVSKADQAIFIQKFVIWSIIIIGFSSISGGIRDDSRSGIIETIWMSAFNPIYIIFFRGLLSSLIVVFMGLSISFLLSIFYGIESIISANVLLACLLAMLTSIGIGLIFGSLTIVFKNIGPLANVIQFLLLPIIMGYSSSEFDLFLVLPGINAIALLVSSTFKLKLLLISFAITFSWLILGLWACSFAIMYSRKNGLVYGY